MAILYDELNGWIAGIDEDLEGTAALPDRDLATREAEAFRRLLAALDRGEIALPDEEAITALAEAAAGHDEMKGFAEVVAVHDAHRALLGVLGGAGAGCGR
ncbi:MAG TPA: hypothetical protein VGH14_15645 [Solirubrobacterales bacterium]|jgi:hypothetical protein